MKALLQRVSRASVSVGDVCVGQIDTGVLALVGIAPQDRPDQAAEMLRKILHYRIFPDTDGRMNRSLIDIAGGLLLVPNFTLLADTRKGLRPSFTPAGAPEMAAGLFAHMCALGRQQPVHFACGEFGADMQVALVNDGPVTLLLERE